MSSETAHNQAVNISVCHSFKLQWTLKGTNIKGGSENTTLRSDLYNFKILEDLRFYLELKISRYCYYVTIHGSKSWLFSLAHVFFVAKGRAYVPSSPKQMAYLAQASTYNFSDDENVTIHCLINVCPKLPDPTDKADDLIVKEDQTMVDFTGKLNVSLPSNLRCPEIYDFISRGAIPNLTVENALRIIKATKQHQCNELKYLCAEYLMGNITAQNLVRIASVAVDGDLPHLERACTQKIINGNIQIKQ